MSHFPSARSLTYVVSGACLASACLAGILAFSPAVQAAQFLNIITDSTSEVEYRFGVVLSQIYRKELPDMTVRAEVANGSADTLNRLQAGDAGLAFASADSLIDAWTGNIKAGFTQPLKKLRVIAGLYFSYVVIIARADSGIKTLADLKGKRISVGTATSGAPLNAKAILDAAGLSNKSFAQVQQLPFAESIDLMENNELDATVQSTNLEASTIRDLANSPQIMIVPIPADIVKRINDPAYQNAEIRPFDGSQTAATPTVAVQNFLVTRESVPNEEVYRMTKGVFLHLGELTAAHDLAKGISPDRAITRLPIPIHPGAALYYKEIGLIR